ncbi:MAG: hypothetical protein ACLUD0_11710 [Eubacterium ramulus]
MYAPAPADVRRITPTFADERGALYFKRNSVMEAVSVGRMARQRIAGMDEIRHLVHRLVKLQQKTGTEEELTRVRHKINQTYDAYVKRYGHLTNAWKQGFPGGCRLSATVRLGDCGKGSCPESPDYCLSTLHHA